MYEEEAGKIEGFVARLTDLRTALNVEDVRQKIATVESEMAQPNFWDDPESAQGVVQKLKGLKSTIEAPEDLMVDLEDGQTLVEMAREENDESMAEEVSAIAIELEEKITQVELQCMLSDPRDSKNAIVSIHPGAGGTESCDWAGMLYRMLLRFCERREFKVEVLDYQVGDEAGIKSVTFMVSAPLAYGYLKSEAGVHRLVRISPFNAQGKRQTSFAAVEVLTEIDDTVDIEIRDDDLKMDVFRASGAGGQHINKTSSAVRLTHIPTGLVVSCQAERSQHKNRDHAIKMLKAKLYDIEMQKKQAELDSQRDGHQDIAGGSQIRSYVMQPYQMIKDHRTNFESGNVTKVMDGNIEPFIEAFLKWKLKKNSCQ
jgi:peptide chain release factor 2